MKNEHLKNIAQVSVKKLSPTAGDIMIVKFPEGIKRNQLEGFAENFVQCLPDNVSALFINADMQIDRVPETEMNKLGWYKFDKNKMN